MIKGLFHVLKIMGNHKGFLLFLSDDRGIIKRMGRRKGVHFLFRAHAETAGLKAPSSSQVAAESTS